jgi:hypothetical protein
MSITPLLSSAELHDREFKLRLDSPDNMTSVLSLYCVLRRIDLFIIVAKIYLGTNVAMSAYV